MSVLTSVHRSLLFFLSFFSLFLPGFRGGSIVFIPRKGTQRPEGFWGLGGNMNYTRYLGSSFDGCLLDDITNQKSEVRSYGVSH